MTVELYVDPLCPWCYIVERRLAAAIGGTDIEVTLRSFELDPAMTREPGATAGEQMRDPAWWGAEAEARMERIRALGEAEGAVIDLERARPVSSFDAHRLIQLAQSHGAGLLALQTVLRAYHTDALNIADRTVLTDLASEVGLPASAVKRLWASGEYADRVRTDERRAREVGVRGVPTFVLPDRGPIGGVLSVGQITALLVRQDAGLSP